MNNCFDRFLGDVTRRMGGALALGAAAMLTAPATAQQETAETAVAPLDVIVVTAQKREQDLQDVSASIAALRGEKLDVLSSAGADIRFLSARVPSLIIESSFGRTFPRFYIRGLGNTDFDLNASQPVSLVYDEVVLENPILKGYPVFDLDRIEVLRGPQGTLFGRNTPAGIVKFDSAKPTQEFEGYGRIAYGRFNAIDLEGAVSGGFSDNVAARISVLYQRRDDWVDNLAPGFIADDVLEGYSEFAGRFQLLFQPSDRISILLNAHGRILDGTARVFRANIIEPGTNELILGFKRDEVFHDGRNSQDVDEFGFVGKVDYDLGPVTLTSVTGYESVELFSRGDIDGGFGAVFAPPSGPGLIPFPSETADAIPSLDQITQEVRLTSNRPAWERVNYQLGFFYFHEDLDIESFAFASLFGGVQEGFAVQSQQTNAWAVFGNADVNVTDRLSVQGGLRYSSDEKDFTASLIQSPIGGDPFGPITRNPSDEVLTWDASAKYAATDDVNLYARVARSFRAPSIQGRTLFFFFLDFFGPEAAEASVSVGDTEKILSYEAGVKSTLLNGRARVNLAGFFYQMEDQQLTAVGGAGNFNTLINADRTEGYGFEADIEWAPTDHLLFTVGASYNHTEIQDPDLTVVACGSACTILNPFFQVPNPFAADGDGLDEVAFIDGNSLPHAPEWIVNWTMRYGIPLGANGEVFFYTDWAYRSRVHFFLYDSAEFSDDVLLEGGLRLGYAANDGGWEFAIFGRNIGNDTSLEGGIDFNNLTGFVNEPPVWGIEFATRF